MTNRTKFPPGKTSIDSSRNDAKSMQHGGIVSPKGAAGGQNFPDGGGVFNNDATASTDVTHRVI